MSRIRFSAINADGLIFIGKRHHNIIATLADCGYTEREISYFPQGFITEEGYFLGREESAGQALKSGQIKELKFSSSQLFSEDLY
jgi:hypothetical protein